MYCSACRASGLYLIIFVLSCGVTSAQTGPGGVGNAATNPLWLRADGGTSTTTNGSPISLWEDQGGVGNHVFQATAAQQPLFRTNQMNGYPAIEFDNVNSAGQNDYFEGADDPSLDNTDGLTIFTVTRRSHLGSARTIVAKRVNVSVNQAYMFFFFNNEYLYVDIASNDNRFSTNPLAFGTGVDQILNLVYDGKLAAAQRAKVYNGQQLLVTATESAASLIDYASPLIIGATNVGDPRPFGGFMAEIVIYREALNTAQRIIVDNYLSAKYNIALTANDFYTMDNPANGNFDHEVAGIGRFSLTEQHTDAQGSSFVRINNASGLDVNGEYLFWGHNNTSIVANNTADVDGTIIEARLNRIWRVSEVGDVGTVTVTFDFSTFSPLVGSDLRLLIDRNGNGFFDNDVTPQAGVVSGSTISFNLVDFQNGDRFTLGSINEAQSPLPVELLSFNAISQTNSVDLIWQTATELNSSHFEVLRSKTGMEWEKIGEIGAQGNSSTPTQYHFSDFNPLAGYSYYKLNMVDLDLSQEFSNVAVVNRTTAEDDINIFPNPANDFVYVESQMGLYNATIRIYDCTGRMATVPVYKDSHKMMVEITTLSSGVYYLEIESEGAVVRKKIVVDKF